MMGLDYILDSFDIHLPMMTYHMLALMSQIPISGPNTGRYFLTLKNPIRISAPNLHNHLNVVFLQNDDLLKATRWQVDNMQAASNQIQQS